MTRNEAWMLLTEYTKNESLIKHALAVEAAMKAYAEKFGEDAARWALTGLLHDFDYEMFPTAPDHPMKGSEILKEKGVDEDIRIAILGHASYTNVARETRLAKTLFAVDELCGLITAAALVRPNRILDLESSSVKKKMKDKAFARTVSREDILQGAEELGVELSAHIQFVIDALKREAEPLGLLP